MLLRRNWWFDGLLLLPFLPLLLFCMITWFNIWHLFIIWCLVLWVMVLRSCRRFVMMCLGAERAGTEVPSCRDERSFLLDVLVALPVGGISLGLLEGDGIRSLSRWWSRVPRFGVHRGSVRRRCSLL